MQAETPVTSTGSMILWLSLMVFLSSGILFGNILVVLSVFRETNLHTVTNYFIVSLAAADISLAAIVVPIQGWREANGSQWPFSQKFCDIFIMLDVMFCTASILNLAAISLDRFVAVTRPISYSKHSNNFRVRVTIALVWTLSFLIALPIACGLNDQKIPQPDVCAMNSPEYIITSSLGSFYIPCIVMIILYSRVFHVIHKRAALRTKNNTSKSHAPQVVEPNMDVKMLAEKEKESSINSQDYEHPLSITRDDPNLRCVNSPTESNLCNKQPVSLLTINTNVCKGNSKLCTTAA
ncbi:(Dopamine) receptor [Cichlidogyrus casuarinus]|uniref:(Dopamine) receptor n=1 Tax=Cichlidogyrus casuarinus TaxID=1844966 RepID=A0ABD2PQM2_9PLAT